MYLEDIMLKEFFQSQEDIIWFHFYDAPRVVKFTEMESKMVATRELGEGGMGSYCSIGKFSVWGDEKVLEMGGGDVCTKMWVYLNATESHTWK